MRYDDCTAQASTRPFIVSVKRQYLSRTQLLIPFSVALRQAHSPALRSQTHPCFPSLWCRLRCAAPVTHQAQGSLTSRSSARRPPLARSVPQKTLGSLPCPIVYSVQIAWLPHGSNFYRAHGRGVARLHNPVAGHLSRVETGTNQNGWMLPNFSPSLQPQPNFKVDLSQTLSWHQRAPSLA
jgi:hypothetical protein